jgi:hypothetical protein
MTGRTSYASSWTQAGRSAKKPDGGAHDRGRTPDAGEERSSVHAPGSMGPGRTNRQLDGRVPSPPSALVAALADAVVEQHARRAGLRDAARAMSSRVRTDQAADVTSGTTLTRVLGVPLLVIIDGGLGAQPRP